MSGVELWQWNGAFASMVADLRPGGAGSFPIRITRYLAGGVDSFFVANDGITGRELYAYDGAAAFLVKDIEPTSKKSADPAGLTALTTASGTFLLFSAKDAATGRELWRSDGTDAGTTRVKDINSGTASSAPTDLTVLASTAVFAASTSSSGMEIWVTDGSASGTQQVRDIYAGIDDSSPRDLTAFNGAIYFAATDAAAGREIWRTNGTGVGTQRVTDVDPAGDANPELLTAGAGGLAFTARTGTSRELFVMDTLESLTQITLPTGVGATISEIAAVGTEFWLAADNGISGQELWRTLAGAGAQIVDINPGPAGSGPRQLRAHFGGIIARADGGPLVGEELFFVTATPLPTATLLMDRPGNRKSSHPSVLTPLGSGFLFSAESETHGIELWETDGSPSGTMLIADIDGDVPLPEMRLDDDPSGLSLVVTNAAPGASAFLLLGLGGGSPLPLPGLRGAILLDPALPLFTAPMPFVVDLTGSTTLPIGPIPELGAPIGFQGIVLNVGLQISNLAIWSSGSTAADGGPTVKAKGSFDDDTGEYKLTLERVDSNDGAVFVALLAVDDEGDYTLIKSRTMRRGSKRSLDGDIEELLSPTDPNDSAATSMEVRVYTKPPTDINLGSGERIWRSYC